MKFQRKVKNVYTDLEQYVDCDARCSECGNLPSFYITWADEDGENSDEHTLYCVRHNPTYNIPPADSRAWNRFVDRFIRVNSN